MLSPNECKLHDNEVVRDFFYVILDELPSLPLDWENEFYIDFFEEGLL